MESYKLKQGFTLVEILVSLVLVGGLVIVLSTLVLPLSINRNTSVQTQGIAFARSYIELVKARWTVRDGTTGFLAGSSSLPVANTTTGADVRLPSGWSLEVDTTTWSSANTIRTLRVTVKPIGTTSPDAPEKWVVVETRIIAPS